MGQSTNAEISYGILFGEGFEFPWDAEEYDGDIETWWRAVNGYKPPFELYDDEGDYLPGVAENDARIGRYFEHRREWLDTNPVPVAIVNYCSADCPMYLLAVAGSVQTANRGYPEKFDVAELSVDADAVQSLIDFCKKWGIETNEQPGWYLSSYWG